MQIFHCPACQQPVFFSNLKCNCGAELIFAPEESAFQTDLTPCINREAIGCNWLAEEEGDLCHSCEMTKVIPDDFRDEHLKLWGEAERAKRWVLQNLSEWGWFTRDDKEEHPHFHLLAEETSAGPANVIMGHDHGLITINVTESDPATRVRRREELSERLRTMIAHFRHEIAHFLFLRLCENEGFLPAFRGMFGDERSDYGEALKIYYANPPERGSHPGHITRYATSHPHEDWAETCAHLMHLVDLLDSAVHAGLENEPGSVPAYEMKDISVLLTRAMALGTSLNHVNRSIGLQDVYPFVISDQVQKKLEFAHKWLSKGLV